MYLDFKEFGGKIKSFVREPCDQCFRIKWFPSMFHVPEAMIFLLSASVLNLVSIVWLLVDAVQVICLVGGTIWMTNLIVWCFVLYQVVWVFVAGMWLLTSCKVLLIVPGQWSWDFDMVMLNKLDTFSGCLIIKNIGFLLWSNGKKGWVGLFEYVLRGKLQNHHTKTTNSVQTYKNNIMQWSLAGYTTI